MHTSGLMKFMSNGPPEPPHRGIRTFPQQTYGVSEESPHHFQLSNTIINRNGYLYRHENAPKFEYHSQLKTINLGEPSLESAMPATLEHPNKNPHKFHLKKGRLSEFVDKNGWMNTVYMMTGDERSKRSRQCNLADRTQKIQALKKAPEYHSHLIFKPQPSHQYNRTLENIMFQKTRIRGRRNREADRQVPKSQRSLSEHQKSCLELQNVKSKMAKTNQQWYKTIQKERMNRQLSLREPKSKESELFEGELQQWQRRQGRVKWCTKSRREQSLQNQQQLFTAVK